ncbi:ABC transporter ATP-binding protein [Polaromonas sp.]|uniref:ABC transporter ATP-binding protein n=1 Tax=Polaromonas sp. TaxID=1869339 RepID=UPI002FC9978F
MSDSSPTMLSIRDLHAWYGESHVLQGINLEVRAGECVTLLGRNGAGRTSTLRAILGLIDKRAGSIHVAGKEVIALPPHRIARFGIGYCPEERGIYASLTAEENLTLLPEVGDNGMTLEQIYAMFPNLKERAHSPGTRLSGGEQQMLAMARILRTGAKLLLLDEITEGLAPVIVQKLGQVIRELKAQGFTLVLVEQNFRFAKHLADRHYVIEHGQVVEMIDRSEVDARQDRLNELLGI